MGVVPNISTWFYSLKSDAFWNDLLVWTAEIANETAPPQVHSVSYGSQGDYPSDAYRERLNAEFQKAGTRGISIIFASGDSGSGCEPTGFNAAPSCGCKLYPSFPATCPYITSIGATAFIANNAGPEKAVMRPGIGYKSGGGFSQEFPAPMEQQSAVNAYLNSGVQLPPSCSFNATNRATPDASALGDIHFQVVIEGQVSSIGGTSASAPTFASIISLLNEKRLNNNKATLGFLNPWIYSTAAANPNAFYDVTAGDNVVAECCSKGDLGGFKAAPGWDPATGVGTPNYEVLVTLV
jgi:tripeptidyl-peptidase-1